MLVLKAASGLMSAHLTTWFLYADQVLFFSVDLLGMLRSISDKLHFGILNEYMFELGFIDIGGLFITVN